MKIITINSATNYQEVVAEIISVLEAGGMVLHPTDTLYGFAVNALDTQAVERVFKIKQRSFSKPLPIIARNMKWVRELAHVSARQEMMLERLWPGVITAVLPKKPVVPSVVTSGNSTVAIRIPDYALLDMVMGKYGYPLTMTSANISGEESSQRLETILSSLSHGLIMPDLVIDAGTLPPSEPSTLIDFTSDQPKILRVGAVKPQKLMELLEI